MYLLFEVFINDSVMCVLRPVVYVIELSQQKQLFLAAPTLLESHKKLRVSHPIKLILYRPPSSRCLYTGAIKNLSLLLAQLALPGSIFTTVIPYNSHHTSKDNSPVDYSQHFFVEYPQKPSLPFLFFSCSTHNIRQWRRSSEGQIASGAHMWNWWHLLSGHMDVTGRGCVSPKPAGCYY